MSKSVSSDVDYPIAELIIKRRSKRAFADKDIDPDKIKSLFEAARWAPSSMNEQPWTYIYATRDQSDLWNKVFDSLNEGNQVWVKRAPLLVVSMARKIFLRNGQPNTSAKYDLGGANAFLSLQATALGLNVHQMGGFSRKMLTDNLNIPDDFEPGVIIAIGYPGDPDQLPENLKERELAPRFRIDQDKFVMNKSF
ncbi:MAG: nitroreductase family protein [Cyclobacteriaceae bacterium]